jgi:signal transduction histidine kinase
VTGAPGEPGAASSPRALLASAVERVAKRARALAADRSPDSTRDVLDCLDEIRQRVEKVMEGADPEPLRVWTTSDPFARPLARAVGHELLREPALDASAAASTLVALRALAALQGDPLAKASTDPHDVDDLEAAMRGADAFELLIEVAHDFRSPLTSILFLSEALRDGHSGPVTDVQRSQLGLIYSAAFALASIASDVMDLGRRKRDLTGDEAEPFALSELLATVERMVRPMVEEKSLELKVVAPPRAHARGHRHALSRVLLNLTTNALKFTEQGTVELGVRPVPHGCLEYYVRDTGRGISPEEQTHLFEPFRRRGGDPDAGHYFSGSGVGLSIARRLVRAMGSDLRLDFSDETGSRFSFVLPTTPRAGEETGSRP